MEKKEIYSREGYLTENYHYFHLKDTAGQERDFHFHEFDKIVLLLSGKVDYLVENETYSLKPWTLLLIKHHTIHKAVIDRKEPYERIILYLNRRYFERILPGGRLTDCFDAADTPEKQFLQPNPEQIQALKTYISSYEKAEKDDSFGAQAMKDTLIMQMLIVIGRMSSAGVRETEKRYDPKIRQALSYINENLNKELSVKVLCGQVYLSRYHFMRLFKAQTGSTVHAYVRQKRLLRAARLIREGCPANRAALDSGFSDYSAFHRAFKESFGVTPGRIKK